jgi:hypothetical protein
MPMQGSDRNMRDDFQKSWKNLEFFLRKETVKDLEPNEIKRKRNLRAV